MTTKKEIADTVKAEMASEITPLEIQLDQIQKILTKFKILHK